MAQKLQYILNNRNFLNMVESFGKQHPLQSSTVHNKESIGEESSFHILTDCEALQVLREKHFGIVVEPPYISFKVSQLVSFLREQPIDSLNFFVEVD